MSVNPIEAQRGLPRFPQGHPSLAKGAPGFKPRNVGLKGLRNPAARAAYEARKAEAKAAESAAEQAAEAAVMAEVAAIQAGAE
jgi:hypothetical protein